MTSIQEIIKCAENGQLENWVDSFLRGEGKNIPFADGLKKQKRYWHGPVQFPLEKLSRCCGPEEEMKYKVSKEHWERKTDAMADYINAGAEFPPLIAEYKNETFTISDGNHRFGTYEKMGLKKHWVIFWCSSEEEFEEMKRIINNEK